jgi:hypothetical protein
MNCREFGRYYTDFRDGNDPELARRMRDHVNTCSHCQPHHRAMQIGIDVLQMTEIEPSEAMLHSLSARFNVRPIR